jgi:hypothetical protein
MSPPNETAVQEAAERLRREKTGESVVDVYADLINPPGRPGPRVGFKNQGQRGDELMIDDCRTLADAYLAIRPPEPRPVACDPHQFIQQPVWWIDDWMRVRDGKIVAGSGVDRWEIKNTQNGMTQWIDTNGYPAYPTEAAARLALHWQVWDRLQEFCAKEGT